LLHLGSKFRKASATPLQVDKRLRIRIEVGLARMLQHPVKTPARFLVRESGAHGQRNCEHSLILEGHTVVFGFGELRKAQPLLGSEISIHRASHFVQGTHHTVASSCDAAAARVLAPLGIGNAADSLPLHLLFQDGQAGRSFIESFLQRGRRLFMLAQASHDAHVNLRTSLVLTAGQQIRTGLGHALLGETARRFEHSPTFQTPCDFKIVARIFRPPVDQRRLQRRNNFLGLALTGAHCSDFFHPLRIFVGQLINMFVVGSSFVKAHQAFFEPRARRVEVGTVGSKRNRLGIGVDGSRIVLQVRLRPR